jgi:REP element-mobilizing transposase RayT
MARKLRVQYAGAIYHISNRGDRRKVVFRSDKDRQIFLETLDEACSKTDWRVHAWCLLPDQYHIILETTKANLVPGMKWFTSTYTGGFNKRHNLSGNLFTDRYRSLPIDGRAKGCFKSACDFVHLVPARAKMLRCSQPLSDYPWSSFAEYTDIPARRFPFLKTERLLREHGIREDNAAGRKQFAKRMESRRVANDGEEFKGIIRGWYFGPPSFRKELLARMRAKPADKAIRETEESKAERIIRQELQRLRWRKQDLAKTRKGDPIKVEIAARLRRESTMTASWIAQRLRMGTTPYIGHLLYLHRKAHK